jgi:hypothetical protein
MIFRSITKIHRRKSSAIENRPGRHDQKDAQNGNMENHRLLELLSSLLRSDIPRHHSASFSSLHSAHSNPAFMSSNANPSGEEDSSSSMPHHHPSHHHSHPTNHRLMQRLQPLSQSQLIQIVLHIADRFPGVDVNEAIQSMVVQEEELAQVCPCLDSTLKCYT